MCIEHSVGDKGTNAKSDVVIVQVLLNFSRPAPLPAIAVDGSVGGTTIDAIREFQSRAMRIATPDGRIDPGGGTLSALRDGVPPFAPSAGTLDWMLQGIMPAATWAKIERYAPSLRTGMANRQINTALREAHFLAQLGHESGAFVYAEEIASGDAYEGRADLGNTQPGDGRRFKGRGLIQLTGRVNYTAYGKDIGTNLTDGDNPKLVATDPSLAVDVACWFWNDKKLNALADADDVTKITRAINGGLNGLADREAYLGRAKFFFNC